MPDLIDKSLESWIRGAACSIRGAEDVQKYQMFILPLAPKNPDDTVRSVIRILPDRIGEQPATLLCAITDANPLRKGIINFVRTSPGPAPGRRFSSSPRRCAVRAPEAKREAALGWTRYV